MTKLYKDDAIEALRETEGALTQKALTEAGLFSVQVTRLGRILDRLGLSEKRQYGRRELIVPLARAIAAIDEMADPLEVPTAARSVDYVVVHVPDRHDPGDFLPKIGEKISRSELIDMIYLREYDGVELCRHEQYYRIYQGELYHLAGGELDGERGCVLDANMIATKP